MGKKLSRAEKKAENERAIAEMEDAMREAHPFGQRRQGDACALEG